MTLDTPVKIKVCKGYVDGEVRRPEILWDMAPNIDGFFVNFQTFVVATSLRRNNIT
jgi:hypothetical protein